MKKETVVRQNRCDDEMNLLLFGCFFLYMGLQFFGGSKQQEIAGGINLAFYFIFVPDFCSGLDTASGRP